MMVWFVADDFRGFPDGAKLAPLIVYRRPRGQCCIVNCHSVITFYRPHEMKRGRPSHSDL